MMHIVRAELRRLARRRNLILAGVLAVGFSVVATLAVFAAATPPGVAPVGRGGVTLAQLSSTGGGTKAFEIGASFTGFFVFVTVIALMAGEFSGGTFRALLLREPHRLRLIVGKLLGVLAVAAGIVAVAEASTFVVSHLFAGGQGVTTSQWHDLASLRVAAGDYLTALAGVAGWAVFGTTLAVIFRSAPIALGVGFAWAGPFENIVVDSWRTGYKVFPGQVLGSLIQGGSPELALTPAALTAAAYTGVAALVALTLVARRDVTA